VDAAGRLRPAVRQLTASRDRRPEVRSPWQCRCVQRAHRFWCLQSSSTSQAHLTRVSTLSSRAYARIRPVMRDDQRKGWSCVPVSCCLSAAGIRFSGHPFPAGGLDLPCGRLTGQRPDPIGIPRFARMSCDRGGCPLYPEDSGAHAADCKSPAAACRIPAAMSLHPGRASIIRGST